MFSVLETVPDNAAKYVKKFDELDKARLFVIKAEKSEMMIIRESNKANNRDYHIFWFNDKGLITCIQCGTKCVKSQKKQKIPCKYKIISRDWLIFLV